MVSSMELPGEELGGDERRGYEEVNWLSGGRERVERRAMRGI